MTVVDCLELCWCEVCAGGVEVAVVVPVDPFEGREFDVAEVAPGPTPADGFGLNSPISVSASALSKASPIDPTDGAAAASASRSV